METQYATPNTLPLAYVFRVLKIVVFCSKCENLVYHSKRQETASPGINLFIIPWRRTYKRLHNMVDTHFAIMFYLIYINSRH